MRTISGLLRKLLSALLALDSRAQKVSPSAFKRVRGEAVCLISALALTGFPTISVAAPREIPPAYGPCVNLSAKDFAGSKSFGQKDRIVGTYYFYWYDSNSKSHIINGDGTDALTDHPKTLEDFSYTSVRWHKKELSDMMAAGLDVVLPVFWGAPSEQNEKTHLHWSYAGLTPLVQAREELLREGKQPPRIGLFYDTSTLKYNQWGEHIDLTTDFGRRWFYATIRDFFSLVPPKHWAMIDGHPIVLLYSAAFAKKQDQAAIDFVKAQFPADFGGRVPYIAREISWQVKSDNTVAWGGALGLKNPGVASLGPGYDHSAVPGRAPLIVKREGGKFYEENWLKLLRRPANFVMVETWNEFHEGTDVCESKEYGRQYIDLTKKYVQLFKRGWSPPWPKGSYSGAKSIGITFGTSKDERGLRWVENDDGLAEPVLVGGREAVAARSAKAGGCYLYFTVDDSFKRSQPINAAIDVEYFDAGHSTLALDFDGMDATAPYAGAYSRSSDTATLTGSESWKTARFHVRRARFVNSQNRGADFRLVLSAPGCAIRSVRLTLE